MSLRNSFLVSTLAAMAAIVLSAATPAQAAPIVIDDFSVDPSSTSYGPTTLNGSASLSRPSSGGFDGNTGNVSAFQSAPRGSRSGSVAVAGGFGTLTLSADATAATGNFLAFQSTGNFDYTALTAVDLTAGGNDTLRIVTGSTVTTSPFAGFVTVSDSSLNSFTFEPTWTTSTTFDIPFTSFTGVNFAQVIAVTVGFENPSAIPGTTGFNQTLVLDSISAVPEPQTLALLGTGGAAIAAGLIRRRRIAAKA